MTVAVLKESVIQTLVEYLQFRRYDPQLSAIAEVDVLLRPSCDDHLSAVDEAYVRETLRPEVERLTVKRSSFRLLSEFNFEY